MVNNKHTVVTGEEEVENRMTEGTYLNLDFKS